MAASIWNPGGQQQVPALPAVAPVSFVKGTVGNPGVNFVGDTDTGMWSESDGYLNFVVNGVTQLRIDPLGNITANKFSGGVELDIASSAVTDIGAVLSNSVRVTGTNAISSFGTTYRGPMFVRFASALTLTYNATTLITPGAATISINAGDSIVVTPKATAGVADGWVVVSYTSGSPNLNAVSSINNGQLAGLRNRIINGGMDISQRGSSFVAIANGAYSLDRWQYVSSSAAVVTVAQVVDYPSSAEFQNSLRYTITTADTSISAGDITLIQHKIEGFNVRDLIGQDFTASFWVRSPKTGVHCVYFTNSGLDRSWVSEYTVIAANTWEKKYVTVSGGLISAGTWDWTSNTGLAIGFVLAAGSTTQTTPGSWKVGNYFATANQVNCLDTVGNIFAVVGVQLERGSGPTPFEHRPFSLERGLCRNYYRVYATAQNVNDLGYDMRAVPTQAGAGPYTYSSEL